MGALKRRHACAQMTVLADNQGDRDRCKLEAGQSAVPLNKQSQELLAAPRNEKQFIDGSPSARKASLVLNSDESCLLWSMHKRSFTPRMKQTNNARAFYLGFPQRAQ